MTAKKMSERVIILGASNKPDRYAYRAFVKLSEAGHEVLPVHPRHKSIEGIPVNAKLSEIQGPIDTLTLYVNAVTALELADEIIALKPGRVIMNPGTESEELQTTLEASGIEVLQACTLVLLSTGQF